jgi:hypothetical protein
VLRCVEREKDEREGSRQKGLLTRRKDSWMCMMQHPSKLVGILHVDGGFKKTCNDETALLRSL